LWILFWQSQKTQQNKAKNSFQYCYCGNVEFSAKCRKKENTQKLTHQQIKDKIHYRMGQRGSSQFQPQNQVYAFRNFWESIDNTVDMLAIKIDKM
jgi:hypothetical protein